ncbi:hypothetical protein BO94DRAFT_579564 [Aspergillus sclerotioniger CBS 115572]|uniref:Uncharacterized protein n=1 Tax=Aspergillus sclerotioniger CBS 115572 TaxID=1450535 RepID=A0A317V1L4_9EURO|nr:hypothetical protein BO94DRAFT_579564 [Aspergillus sclerotioniger CBS 115572]PWY67281.1 hypothetical protein BO94DRAFT_579564 [Aspergillus sclerotioniger CBS 115572]
MKRPRGAFGWVWGVYPYSMNIIIHICFGPGKTDASLLLAIPFSSLCSKLNITWPTGSFLFRRSSSSSSPSSSSRLVYPGSSPPSPAVSLLLKTSSDSDPRPQTNHRVHQDGSNTRMGRLALTLPGSIRGTSGFEDAQPAKEADELLQIAPSMPE